MSILILSGGHGKATKVPGAFFAISAQHNEMRILAIRDQR